MAFWNPQKRSEAVFCRNEGEQGSFIFNGATLFGPKEQCILRSKII